MSALQASPGNCFAKRNVVRNRSLDTRSPCRLVYMYVPWYSPNTAPVIWAASRTKTTRRSDFVVSIILDDDEGGGSLFLFIGVLRRILRADALKNIRISCCWRQSVCLKKTEKDGRMERNRRQTRFLSSSAATTWRGRLKGSVIAPSTATDRPTNRPSVLPAALEVSCNTRTDAYNGLLHVGNYRCTRPASAHRWYCLLLYAFLNITVCLATFTAVYLYVCRLSHESFVLTVRTLTYSYFCLSVCLPVCLSVCLLVCLFNSLFVCLFVYLSVCLSVCQSPVCLSVCLSVCLYVCLFICLTISLFVCLSICLTVCLSVCLFVWLSICLFVCLSVYLPVWLSICRSFYGDSCVARVRP